MRFKLPPLTHPYYWAEFAANDRDLTVVMLDDKKQKWVRIGWVYSGSLQVGFKSGSKFAKIQDSSPFDAYEDAASVLAMRVLLGEHSAEVVPHAKWGDDKDEPILIEGDWYVRD